MLIKRIDLFIDFKRFFLGNLYDRTRVEVIRIPSIRHGKYGQTRPALSIFIIKFGYNAHCHWLKERAL